MRRNSPTSAVKRVPRAPFSGLAVRAAGVGLILLAGTATAARATPEAPTQRATLVETGEGPVRGVADGDVIAWKGIPFAAPPLGPLRWRHPQPPPKRDAVLEATDFGPACPQVAANPLRPGADGPQGAEDCLHLNIWAPAVGEGPWPVMVWIHGGGHIQGSSGEAIYDGSSLAAEQGVVVASINYRLGALGYLAHPALAESAPSGPVAGNYGLLDQIAALKWLRRNLPAFGGDPERLAIFGESAGGVSVCALMVSPLSRWLFSAAIMQSGACTPGRTMRALAPVAGQPDAYEQGRRFSAAIGCGAGADEAACLREQPVERVLSTLPGSVGILNPDAETYGETVDGWALPQGMAEAVAYGHAAPVPWIIGANADEATVFLSANQKAMSYEAFALLVRRLYPSAAAAILTLYPESDYATGGDALAAVTGDIAFVCPARRIAGWKASWGHPTWLYHFSHVTAAAERLGLGAHHGAEIPFVFRMSAGGPLPLRGPELALSEAMREWWTGMAAQGAPQDRADLAWPRFNATSNIGMGLDTPPTRVAGWRDDRCDLWDAHASEILLPDGGPVATPPPPSWARVHLPLGLAQAAAGGS